ncbi:MAG: acetate--CoA ligase family protein [Burkholderiaceae bacterium]
MTDARTDNLLATIDPRSVAVLGASENPDKVGGRPIHYMLKFGYQGAIYPINPSRDLVQGLRSYKSLDDLPEVPELAVIVVSGDAALQAMKDCARIGVKAAIVIASGFGEVDEAGAAMQRQMRDIARAAGMRMVGPNSQGFANFASGAISSFSTMFIEYPPEDGPVAIISQSGALSAAVYGLLRRRGIGVRYMNATGNEADVNVPDVARLIVRDPDLKLVLLYLEHVADPGALAEAAAIARERGLPIVAIKSGRTASGQQMAASHTGSLANEDRVVDAFFRRHGIWRVNDPHAMARGAPMYLRDWHPEGNHLIAISNSGASCVLVADAADGAGLALAQPSEATRAAVRKVLPAFATSTNPIDLTGAVLSNNALLGNVLEALAGNPETDLVYIEIPVAGQGYDIDGFARVSADFAAKTGKPLAIGAWQDSVAAPFRAVGLPVYDHADDALGALAQLAGHAALQRVAMPAWAPGESVLLPTDAPGFLNEAQSLAVLQAAGLPVVAHRVCHTRDEAIAAFEAIGAPVVVKACSRDVPHKSEHGLVALKLASADAVAAAFDAQSATLARLGAVNEGVIVAAMRGGQRELMLGAHVDPVFGPVVVVGDGGKYVEALKDSAVLVPPFTEAEVEAALQALRIGPILDGVRGDPPVDLNAFARAAVALGRMNEANAGRIASVDVNPVIAGAAGEGAVVVDGLVEVRAR